MFYILYKTGKHLSLLFFVLLYAFSGYAQVPSYVPTSGLLAYYAFNGNANNSHGSGNNGVAYGSVTYGTDRFGATNSCYVGNGSSGIDLPGNNFPSGNAARSVSAWFKSVLPYPTSTFPYREIFATGSNAAVGRRFGLHCDGTHIGFESTGVTKQSSLTIDSAWHHLVITYPTSGTGLSSIKVYVDGVLTSASASGTLTSLNTDTGTIHHIGTLFMPAYTGSWLYSWIGSLDDIAVWNRELTACEVASLHAGASSVIVGATSVSVGATIVLADSVTGGTWSSSATTVATVGSSSGVVTGASVGIATITYTYTGGCYATQSVNVISASTGCATPGIITTIAGSGSSTYSGDGGPATAAGISGAWFFGSDTLGNIYIPELHNARIRKVNTSGLITTVAGTGTTGFSGDGGPATNATFYNPSDVATDALGNVFIADMNNHRVRKIDASGIITTIAGNGVGSAGGDGGAATAAGILPVTIAVDGSNNLYICDNYRIRKVNSSGIINTIAGTGAPGFSGDGGPATAAMLSSATQINFDNSGNIVFCDVINQRIRKINSSGVISTIAGSGGAGTGAGGFSGDGGPATAALLKEPNGVTFDSYGNMYIADVGNKRIRKVNTLGVISTFAGTGSMGFSGDGGPATAAVFSNAMICLQTLPGRSIATWDNNNYRLRKIAINNSAPYFTGGSSQNIIICRNSGANGINSVLAVRDTDMYDSEVWSILSGPSHGSTSVSFAASSTGIVAITPTGLTYTPATGYTGNDTFRVKVSDGCLSDTISIYVTVLPTTTATISGTLTVCPGATTTLSCSAGGGWWSSSNTAIATIGSSTGIVTGVSSGTSAISYNFSTSCPATALVTVNSVPAIAGSSVIDIYSTTTLTGSPTGGTWSSSNVTVASVGSSTGVVTGNSVGIATVTYTAGCYSVKSVTVSIPATINTFAGTGTAAYGGDGGHRSACDLNSPTYVTKDNAGNVYIADESNHRVRKVSPSGIVSTIAGNGTASSTGDGGSATAATLNQPSCVVTDAAGNIFIADRGGNRVRKINSAGIITTYAGTGVAAYGGDGGPATAATIIANGLALDNLGNLYIANNNNVRKVNTSGIITRFAGTVTSGFSGDGGPATSALVETIERVTVDRYRNVYLNDFINHRIRKVDTNGIITTIAWCGTIGDLAVDTAGNLYFSEGNWVRKITAAGASTTIAGAGSGFAGDGCAASGALFNWVRGIYLDTGGYVYLADRYNNRIRRISQRGYYPHFVNGGNQAFPVCANSSANPINTLLAVTDSNGGIFTWSVIAAPAHGTAVAAYAVAITGTSVTPTGLYYTPASGYTGTDTFKVKVTDCLGLSDTTVLCVTVNPLPSSITGAGAICAASSITLISSTSGGVWTSSATGIATVGSATGIVSGISAGVATISYSLPTGCFATKPVTVNPLPLPISGLSSICAGATTAFFSPTTGGLWSSGVTGVATAGSFSGYVTGVSAGTTTISYTLSTGCSRTISLTVNPVPMSITGSPVVCLGHTSPLSDATPGGFWTSSAAATADVGVTTGVVTGLLAGTATITYTLSGSGCYATLPVTVNFGPTPVTGTGAVCAGATASLYNGVPGGTWISGATGIATIDPATGVYTGVSAGTATIS